MLMGSDWFIIYCWREANYYNHLNKLAMSGKAKLVPIL